jgi:esterase
VSGDDLPAAPAPRPVEVSWSAFGAGASLVILHGLFGSKRNWTSIASSLGRHHRVLAVDLRNHGMSPWDDRHDYPALAADIARFIELEAGGRAPVIGHSMGGKTAMMLALTRPDLVERLVVVDIPPAVSRGPIGDVLQILRSVPLERYAERAEVQAALAERIPDPKLRGFLMLNVVAGPDGLAWAVNLDALARHFDLIAGFPEVSSAGAFRQPTLFLVGGHSDYVRPEHHAEIRRLFPAATIEVLPGAGHWVHADAPAAFVASIERFLTHPRAG